MFIWFMALLYTFANVYISWRIYILAIRTIPGLHSKGRAVTFSLLYFFVATTPVSGSLLPHGAVQGALLEFGDWWLCIMIYIGMMLLVFEAAYYLIKQYRPSWIRRKRLHFVAICIIAAVSTFLTVAGGIQAEKMVTTTYHVPAAVEKQADAATNVGIGGTLKIAFVADLHLGRNVGMEEMIEMVGRINAIRPDLVVFGGDIFDNDYQLIENPEKIIGVLKKIRSKYGVYAVYGNHDVDELLIAGFAATPKILALRTAQMEGFISDAGMIVLEDRVISIGDGTVQLAGRKDQLQTGDGTSKHLSAEKLLGNLDPTVPLIVAEHEPIDLKELSEAGADLILSGHTHAGQMFPVTMAMPLIWENPFGMLDRYGATSIVTSGVGLYGPPIRVLTKGEVVEIVWAY